MTRHSTALAVILLLAACSGGEAIYSSADTGRTIDLSVGDAFVIELRGNPSTGYGWEVLEPEDPHCRLLSEAFHPHSDLIGATGAYRFTFEATKAGAETLQMVYARSWEDVEPLETFELDLNIGA